MNWMLLRPYTGIPTDCNISYKRSISIFDGFIENGIGNGIIQRNQMNKDLVPSVIDPLPHPQGIHLGYGCGVRNQFWVDKLPASLKYQLLGLAPYCYCIFLPSTVDRLHFSLLILSGYRASKLALLLIRNDDTIGWMPLCLYQLL